MRSEGPVAASAVTCLQVRPGIQRIPTAARSRVRMVHTTGPAASGRGTALAATGVEACPAPEAAAGVAAVAVVALAP